MTEARESHLLAQITTLGSVSEAMGFRDALRGEQMTSAIYAALLARIDYLQRRGLT